MEMCLFRLDLAYQSRLGYVHTDLAKLSSPDCFSCTQSICVSNLLGSVCQIQAVELSAMFLRCHITIKTKADYTHCMDDSSV